MKIKMFVDVAVALALIEFCGGFTLLAQNSGVLISRVKRITNVIDSYPMQSPDGNKIVFTSNRSGDWEVYVINTDGSGLQNLTQTPGSDFTPIWSPDGKKIAFASERDNDSEIYLMNADGTNQTRLTNIPGDDSHPHWFPDGTRIIFNSARTSADLELDWSKQYHEIFSMSVNGSDVKQITAFKAVSTYPSVSPDGKKIAYRKVIDGPAFNWDFSQNVSNRNSEVFVMDITGRNDVNISSNAYFDGWPWWSPDSKKVVFSSNRGGPESGGQLYTVNADGTGQTRLTDLPGSVVQPNWAKDGKTIYAYQCWETSEYEYGSVVAIDTLNMNDEL